MTRDQNHDDASSTKRIKTCDQWSDLNPDVLFLIMMQLGVVDFLAFSKVCKSWRSLALSNKNKFIVSKPPMTICISKYTNEKECYLEDFERRKLKTFIPYSADRTCIGVSCGYLILFGDNAKDFWLVNPITRHELHVPFPFPFPHFSFHTPFLGAILVFSPSISGWVFVVFSRYYNKIWFSIAGKREWTCVSTLSHIYDLRVFKGKIYTLHYDNSLSEVRLFPTPEVMLLEIKNYSKPGCRNPRLVSSGEKLYVINRISEFPYKIQELSFTKMEWLSAEKIGDEYAFFLSIPKEDAVFIGIEPWADLYSQYGKCYFPDKSGKGGFFHAKMWYFFHDCLNVNFPHEW